MKEQLQLEVTEVFTPTGVRYQCLSIVANQILPSVLSSLELPQDLNLSRGVILWGSAPIWLYSYLITKCHQAPWVGCYSVRDGVIIVASRTPKFTPGDRFSLVAKLSCPAILIGGPPKSGKSVLSRALDLTLESKGLKNTIHLHRAQWDGEGDWFADMENRNLAKALSKQYRGKPVNPQAFFQTQGRIVDEIRQAMNLVLVDFGGLPQPSDVILLERCTHYIIISSQPELIPYWHEFCGQQGKLTPLAVIHSVLEERLEVLQMKPYLEIIAGSWHHSQTRSIPDVLWQRILSMISEST